MSDQPSSRNYIQAESVDFRSPVSESMLKTFAGTTNWLLDKDTSNDIAIGANTSNISTLTGRVNNAVGFSASSVSQTSYGFDSNPRSFTYNGSSHNLIFVRFSQGSSTDMSESGNNQYIRLGQTSTPFGPIWSYVLPPTASLTITFTGTLVVELLSIAWNNV